MTKHSVNIITKNSLMLQILETLNRIIDSDFPILLTGETGVGKEVFADYIHYHSYRKDKPFIKLGLASLPPDLLESELFRHTKGAYTNAIEEKKGLFELADSGSIFLDDIDDFPFHLQAKLLRVIENKEIIKIGAEKTISFDARIIAATKIDLKDLVKKGNFRSDLFYRLNVIPIRIPPLRQRKEDIPFLAEYFLTKNHSDFKISEEIENRLLNYNWPGNVRELRNVIDRISLFRNNKIETEDLTPDVPYPSVTPEVEECVKYFHNNGYSLKELLHCLEVHLIKKALEKTSGNKLAAAKMLKINISTFRDKLEKMNLG